MNDNALHGFDHETTWGYPEPRDRCGGCLWLVADGARPGAGYCTVEPATRRRPYPHRCFNWPACRKFEPAGIKDQR